MIDPCQESNDGWFKGVPLWYGDLGTKAPACVRRVGGALYQRLEDFERVRRARPSVNIRGRLSLQDVPFTL